MSDRIHKRDKAQRRVLSAVTATPRVNSGCGTAFGIGDAQTQCPHVASNWNDEIPVNEKELAVLELYLADALGTLINSRRPTAANRAQQARGPP